MLYTLFAHYYNILTTLKAINMKKVIKLCKNIYIKLLTNYIYGGTMYLQTEVKVWQIVYREI